MSVIVSANYRDRSAKNWLIRNDGDPLDQYELRDSVVIKDFEFCPSHSGEVGFGCTIVAVGQMEIEESSINKESLISIRFTGVSFRETESDKHVARGSALVLDSTGMYYIPV